MIHSPTSSTQNPWFFHDDRLLFVVRHCLLCLDSKLEAFDDEHEVSWSSISTWISATKQIARVTENIADENCEGWETWGVFDFSMNRWTLRKRLLKRQWFLVHFQLGLLSHSVDTTAEMFYGPRNESCTWRLLKAEYWWRSIQQTSHSQLGCFY